MKITGNPPQTALFLVDLQRDFLASDGRMPVRREHAGRVIDAANRLLNHADLVPWKTVFIKNAFRQDDWLGNLVRGKAAIEGSVGAEIDPRVMVPPDAEFVAKAQADAFSNPALASMLQAASIHRIVLLGVMTEACVRSTAKSALRRGYELTIVANAVASTRPMLHRWALRSLQEAGATIRNCSELLLEQ